MTRQQYWNKYREQLGNISVIQAKIMRRAFLQGFENGLDEMSLQLNEVNKASNIHNIWHSKNDSKKT